MVSTLFAIIEERDNLIKSPMPGCVKTVFLKEPGTSFKKGTPLFVLECMKMQNTIRAPKDGVIGFLFVKEGETVKAAQSLLDCAVKSDKVRSPDVPLLSSPLQNRETPLQEEILEGPLPTLFHVDAVNNSQRIEKIPFQGPQDAEHHQDILDAVVRPHDPGGPSSGAGADAPLGQETALCQLQPLLVAPELDAPKLVVLDQQIALSSGIRVLPQELAVEQEIFASQSPLPVREEPAPLIQRPPHREEMLPTLLDETPPLQKSWQEAPLVPQIFNPMPLERPSLQKGVAPPLAHEVATLEAMPLRENIFEAPVLRQEIGAPEILKQENTPVWAAPIPPILQTPLGAEALPVPLEERPLIQEVRQEAPIRPSVFDRELVGNAPILLQEDVPFVPMQAFEHILKAPVLTKEIVGPHVPEAIENLLVQGEKQESVLSTLRTLSPLSFEVSVVPENAFLSILEEGLVAANFELPLEVKQKGGDLQNVLLLQQEDVGPTRASFMSTRPPVFGQDAFQPPLWGGGHGRVADQNISVSPKRSAAFFHGVTERAVVFQRTEGAILRATHQNKALFSSQEIDEMKGVLAQSWRSLKDLGVTPLGILCLALAGLLAMLPSPMGVDWRVVARSLRVSYALMKMPSSLPPLKSVRIPLHAVNR